MGGCSSQEALGNVNYRTGERALGTGWDREMRAGNRDKKGD